MVAVANIFTQIYDFYCLTLGFFVENVVCRFDQIAHTFFFYFSFFYRIDHFNEENSWVEPSQLANIGWWKLEILANNRGKITKKTVYPLHETFQILITR